MYVYASIGHINLYGRYVTLMCFKYIHINKTFFTQVGNYVRVCSHKVHKSLIIVCP